MTFQPAALQVIEVSERDALRKEAHEDLRTNKSGFGIAAGPDGENPDKMRVVVVMRAAMPAIDKITVVNHLRP